VISLKSKLSATIAIILIISIALVSVAEYVEAAPKGQQGKPAAAAQKMYNIFTLEASGTAENVEGEIVEVAFSIHGNAKGKIKNVFRISTKGGDVIVETFNDISATKGQGIIVNKNNFIHLNVMMSTQYYGGRSTVWILRGTTGTLDLTENTMPIQLHANRVVLPLEGYPQLTNLNLEGTITFA
jgi:uncharacterized protein YpmB